MMTFRNTYLFVYSSLLVFIYTKEVKVTVTSINCAYDFSSRGSEIIIHAKNQSPRDDGLNLVVLNPLSGNIVVSASFTNTRSTKFNDFLANIKNGHVVIVTSQLLCSQENTTNLRKQKAILYGFKKLGATSTIPPVSFRSGVYVFCKTKCLDKFKANIEFPVKKFQKTNEDAVLVSFTMETVACETGKVGCSLSANGKTIIKGTPVLKKTAIQKNESKKKSGNIGLIVVGAVLPLLLLVFLVSALVYFRANKHKRREQMRKELSSTALKFCEEKRTTRLARMNSDEQKLISESQSPPPVEIKLAKSFRLFQKHGKCDQTDRLNPEKGNSNFPTYVGVSASPDQAALYKVPTNIRRHEPPTHLPPLQDATDTDLVRTQSDAYLDMTHHDYESVNDVGFISTSGERTEEEEENPVFVNDAKLRNAELCVFDSYNRVKSLYEHCSTSLKNSASDYDYGSYTEPLP